MVIGHCPSVLQLIPQKSKHSAEDSGDSSVPFVSRLCLFFSQKKPFLSRLQICILKYISYIHWYDLFYTNACDKSIYTIHRPISSQQPGIMAGKVFAKMLRFVHTIEPTPPSSQPRLWYRKLPHFKLLSSSQWQFQRFAFASFRKCKAEIVLDSQKFGNKSGQAHKVSKVCRLDLTLILLSDSICPELILIE